MQTLGTIALGLVVGVGLGGAVTLRAQSSKSAAPAKEVAALMTKAKMDCVVMENNTVFGGYVAALNVPGAELTVVSARFKDTTSMAYKLYKKDCMGAYEDLNAAVDAMDRVVIDDIGADGLVATPKKDMPRDSIARDGKTIKLDGDSKVLKQQKVTPEEFAKTFASADETYTQLLLLLSAELKK